MNEKGKTTVFTDNPTGPKNPTSQEVSTVALESFASNLVTIEWPASPAKATYTKEKGSVKDHMTGKPLV